MNKFVKAESNIRSLKRWDKFMGYGSTKRYWKELSELLSLMIFTQTLGAGRVGREKSMQHVQAHMPSLNIIFHCHSLSLPLSVIATVMQHWSAPLAQLRRVRDCHTFVGYEYSILKWSSCINGLHPLSPCSKACPLASSAGTWKHRWPRSKLVALTSCNL